MFESITFQQAFNILNKEGGFVFSTEPEHGYSYILIREMADLFQQDDDGYVFYTLKHYELNYDNYF